MPELHLDFLPGDYTFLVLDTRRPSEELNAIRSSADKIDKDGGSKNATAHDYP